MNVERRLIQLFKSFVERVFLPQLKSTDRPALEWNKFGSMLSQENINYQQIIAYVDSFTNNQPFTSFEKREQIPLFKKKKEEVNEMGGDGGSGGFNPSKTFGGERARMMFPIKNDMDDFSEQKPQFSNYNSFGMSRQDPTKKSNPTNPQVILPGLQRLCKTFLQNQQRIQNLLNGVAFSPNKHY